MSSTHFGQSIDEAHGRLPKRAMVAMVASSSTSPIGKSIAERDDKPRLEGRDANKPPLEGRNSYSLPRQSKVFRLARYMHKVTVATRTLRISKEQMRDLPFPFLPATRKKE